MEDSRARKTRNWGRLLEGEEARFALLRIDVVKSSILVHDHGEAAARGAYEDLRSIISRCVEIRSGRIWSWEGDGALGAFHFGHPTTRAVLAGMAILHELFLYNRTSNLLGRDIQVRAAVHTGHLRYAEDPSEIARQETARELREVESKLTPPGALTITPAVDPTLDRVIRDRFHPGSGDASRFPYYEVRLCSP
jgi:class 3 adenylate cyclase